MAYELPLTTPSAMVVGLIVLILKLPGSGNLNGCCPDRMSISRHADLCKELVGKVG